MHGALGFERLPEYGPGPTAEASRTGKDHLRRPAGQYLLGGDRPGRHGAGPSRHLYVRDATAARSPEAMHAAVNIDAPTYAHEILSTAELVAAIKASPLAA